MTTPRLAVRTIEDISAEMSTLVNAAEGRSLTDDEVSRYEALEGELSAVRRDGEIRARQAAYTATHIPAGMPRPGGQNAAPDSYAAAFNHYMRTGQKNADLVQLPTNAQSEGVPSEGGYLVPDTFRQKLIEKLKAFGGIANVAEHYQTGNGAPVEWPTVDDTGNFAEIVQEGNTFSSGADVVFGTNQLSSYSYVAGGAGSTPIRVSLELAQDSAFDMESLLARLLGQRIARLQAQHFATGTGVGQPLGLVTGRTPVQAAANTGATFADLVGWIHSLDPAYRANARWVMNDATLKMFELFVDSHGDPIFRGWGAGMDQGFNEDRLLGYPVTIDQAMPDWDADDSTDLAIAFGDIRQGYVIRDVRNVELLVNPYSRMNYRQIEYTAWARADATQQDTNAYIVASGKS